MYTYKSVVEKAASILSNKRHWIANEPEQFVSKNETFMDHLMLMRSLINGSVLCQIKTDILY